MILITEGEIPWGQVCEDILTKKPDEFNIDWIKSTHRDVVFRGNLIGKTKDNETDSERDDKPHDFEKNDVGKVC